jgi:MFS family permease
VAPIGLAFAVLRIAASVVPQILLLLVGGVAADRLPRQRVMVWSNVVCAVAEAAAALLLVSGTARVWHLVTMSAVCGAAGAFFTPAAGGIVVEVVPPNSGTRPTRC